jgi:DeoR/GlpR family transcriptional regulator of sugar metabolism
VEVKGAPAVYSLERRQEILKLIEQEPYVSVVELAARFGVSRASIRRDLTELTSLGLMERTYGGAVKPPASSRVIPFTEREVSYRDQKERIGKAAAALVAPGEFILIDDGTTTPYLVPHLAGIPRLTVATWAVNILNELVSIDDAEVVVIGGTLNRSILRLGGFLTMTSLDAYQMHFGKFFLAASAVSAKAGVMGSQFEVIPVKRKAIELSHETILLADSSKIGTVAAGQIVPSARIHRLITGQDASATEVAKLRDLGVIVDLV